ncbi:ABC transporter permease [Paenibacillus turpanensis]|uniref:ABC transporter permease n=1 Tax=Paenibacillus turpanensis TaxID=2689078 RepID=UPI00140B9E28|nr:ABC transporter permease [Paenibacillus turpanensis]
MRDLLRDPGVIRKQRSEAYWKGIAPLFRYVLQSGFGLFVGAVVIGIAFWYSDWLKTVPADYPAHWAGTVLLAPLLWWSPIRTYLREPDMLFLLPMESSLGGYFQRSRLNAWLGQTVLLLIALGVFWLLYSRTSLGAEGHAFWLYAIVIAAGKWASVLGAWYENRLRETVHRRLFAFLRLLVCAGVMYVLLRFELERSGLFSLLVWGTLLLGYRLVPAYAMANWTRLFDLERQHARRMQLFLSQFVELSEPLQTARPRLGAARLADRIPFSKQYTFLYLYAKTVLRSDVTGIVLRLAAIEWLVVLLYDQWLVKAAAFVIFAAAAGVQLRTLEKYHRETFWTFIYPLEPQGRVKAARAVASTVWATVVLVMAVPLLSLWL